MLNEQFADPIVAQLARMVEGGEMLFVNKRMFSPFIRSIGSFIIGQLKMKVKDRLFVLGGKNVYAH